MVATRGKRKAEAAATSTQPHLDGDDTMEDNESARIGDDTDYDGDAGDGETEDPVRTVGDSRPAPASPDRDADTDAAAVDSGDNGAAGTGTTPHGGADFPGRREPANRLHDKTPPPAPALDAAPSTPREASSLGVAGSGATGAGEPATPASTTAVSARSASATGTGTLLDSGTYSTPSPPLPEVDPQVRRLLLALEVEGLPAAARQALIDSLASASRVGIPGAVTVPRLARPGDDGASTSGAPAAPGPGLAPPDTAGAAAAPPPPAAAGGGGTGPAPPPPPPPLPPSAAPPAAGVPPGPAPTAAAHAALAPAAPAAVAAADAAAGRSFADPGAVLRAPPPRGRSIIMNFMYTASSDATRPLAALRRLPAPNGANPDEIRALVGHEVEQRAIDNPDGRLLSNRPVAVVISAALMDAGAVPEHLGSAGGSLLHLTNVVRIEQPDASCALLLRDFGGSPCSVYRASVATVATILHDERPVYTLPALVGPAAVLRRPELVLRPVKLHPVEAWSGLDKQRRSLLMLPAAVERRSSGPVRTVCHALVLGASTQSERAVGGLERVAYALVHLIVGKETYPAPAGVLRLLDHAVANGRLVVATGGILSRSGGARNTDPSSLWAIGVALSLLHDGTAAARALAEDARTHLAENSIRLRPPPHAYTERLRLADNALPAGLGAVAQNARLRFLEEPGFRGEGPDTAPVLPLYFAAGGMRAVAAIVDPAAFTDPQPLAAPFGDIADALAAGDSDLMAMLCSNVNANLTADLSFTVHDGDLVVTAISALALAPAPGNNAA
ncbi:hypothetical protein HYH03_017845 [Edaphochlamys debaryana]|uniref:Uncharacterized protein n=1 Tax=Edaphochlamys debaryana TaxID=47281 RepID=A0A836BQ69_9CHLO|nr:hypothetical protein HYH03_017845 [Edaphochlamys debaryana]|eukprot:KAG2483298.1 hypothetical protein HYH03_017845 [Edaphochlamys debaryana]